MRAKDIMATVVASVGPDTDVSEIARTLISRNISGVPVIDSNGKCCPSGFMRQIEGIF